MDIIEFACIVQAMVTVTLVCAAVIKGGRRSPALYAVIGMSQMGSFLAASAYDHVVVGGVTLTIVSLSYAVLDGTTAGNAGRRGVE